MPEVHLRTVDLNLLHALRALLEERHVTRAAERCFVSQPAMSRALERLREMFGDVLLVRHGRVYECTVRGERVLRELEWLMPRLEAMVRGEPFDPARSQERFRVAMTDYAFTVLMPVLAERVRATAPTVRIAACVWREEHFDELVAGRIDVALSPLGAPPGLEAALLFREDFVCLVGSKRPGFRSVRSWP
jgi:DNA-binding transcriptional LysR family regulator